jgi:hypothetical protein
MSRRSTILVAVLAFVCLAIGIVWTMRLNPPYPAPWWWRKNAEIHVEVYEPGNDMATVAMTLPKTTFDNMLALGLPATIEAHGHKVHLNEIRGRLERLPRGEKIKIQDEDATIYLWIDVKE